MLLYQDILTEDEMFSDAYDPKEVDDVVYEVNCKMISLGGDKFDIGANPSAEEGGEEDLDDGAKLVNDVVDSFRLQPTSFDKKTYLLYLKGYMKAVKAKLQETNPGRVEAFEKGAQAYAKKIIANFNDYEFFTGASMNDGMVVLLNFREDNITRYLTFWKDGLKEIKL
ncbi:translationally controlled tumor-associated [Tricholoma matsutake]|nr:translationally controlled tumor-associated [Tricholoma matsutake 945]